MLGDSGIVCTCRTLSVVNICAPPWGRRLPGVPQHPERAGFRSSMFFPIGMNAKVSYNCFWSFWI